MAIPAEPEARADRGGPPLRLVPLGGLGEIGRNMMGIECGDDIVVVDSGIMFPEEDMLGVDLVVPDIAWLADNLPRVRAICLTHGHEDHIGALPYVLPRIPVPVYGSRLTVGFLSNKLREHRLLDSVEVHTVAAGDTVKLGAMTVEWIHVTHSIPDACALAIHTARGVVVHTGDFKLDQTPITGLPPDLGRLSQLGDQGVLILLSDSTNVEVDGMTPSERLVGDGLTRIIGQSTGRVIVATFASNISRTQQVVDVAHRLGRRCFIAGRSMMNNVKVAQEMGYLKAPQEFVAPGQVDRIPDDELVVLCTGAQGEPLSALTRMAAGEHQFVKVRQGDTVVLSANPIPGNEQAVHRTVNLIYKRGGRVFQGARHGVHCSGHAAREELKLMLTVVRPQYFVPVHGEYRHLALHAELARSVGVPRENVLVADDGTVVQVDDSGIHALPQRVSAGYVFVDGLAIEEAGDIVFRDRREMAQDGVVIVVLTVERSTGRVVSGPELVSRGFIEDTTTDRVFDEGRNIVLGAVQRLPPDADVTIWQDTIHHELSRFLFRKTRRRPLILPVVSEV